MSELSTRLAETTRGGIVESVHDGVVVAVASSGAVVASAGDPETIAFFRSSAKPFQAIPVIESGAADQFGFTPSDLALCCASHHAEYRQQQQVLAMLGKLGLDDSALQCGSPLPIDDLERANITAGLRAKSPLQCDCSGKHTGMIASCLATGLPIHNYLEPEHPLQQQIKALVAEACRVPVESVVMGTDGCSVPTFGTSIRAFATAFSALADPTRVPAGAGGSHAVALDRLRAAMIAFPENVSGQHSLVAEVMRIGNGAFVCKSGAEGLFCLGAPERGIGLAIRIADGSFRAHGVVLASALEQLGLATPEQVAAILAVEPPQLLNHNGRLVGEIRPAFRMN
jgi:L-asparaginase II